MPIETVRLRSIKSYYIGGADIVLSNLPVQKRQIVPTSEARDVDANGTYTVGQLYVQEYRLENPRYPYPILLWHGGGMCGSQWEATPDGRDGWLWHFLQMGFDVLVSDGPERGRSPWFIPSPINLDDLPVYRSRKEAWTIFRIGASQSYSDDPAERVPFSGQQFPTEAFNAFTCQFVPRWLGHTELELRGYEALVSQVGPCILVGHSQGAGYALRIAQTYPRFVRAVVALEPTGMPENADRACMPHLAVWGDYFRQSPIWTSYRNDAQRFWDKQTEHGPASLLDLPAQGIAGNSHFMMLDRNNRDIAALVIEWLQRSVD